MVNPVAISVIPISSANSITDADGFIKKEYTSDYIHLDYNNDKRAVVGKLVNEFSKQLKVNEKILTQGDKRLKELGKK